MLTWSPHMQINIKSVATSISTHHPMMTLTCAGSCGTVRAASRPSSSWYSETPRGPEPISALCSPLWKTKKTNKQKIHQKVGHTFRLTYWPMTWLVDNKLLGVWRRWWPRRTNCQGVSSSPFVLLGSPGFPYSPEGSAVSYLVKYTNPDKEHSHSSWNSLCRGENQSGCKAVAIT